MQRGVKAGVRRWGLGVKVCAGRCVCGVFLSLFLGILFVEEIHGFDMWVALRLR